MGKSGGLFGTGKGSIDQLVLTGDALNKKLKFLTESFPGGLEIVSEYTEIRDLEATLQAVRDEKEISQKKISAKSVKGRKISCIKIGNKRGIGKRDVRRAFIIAGAHGSEGTFPVTGVLQFVYNILGKKHPAQKHVNEEWRIYLVPLINPDGFFDPNLQEKSGRFKKENKHGININRDYDDEKSPEACAVNGYLKEFILEAQAHKFSKGPFIDLLLDLHGCHGAEYFIFKKYNLHRDANRGFASKAYDAAKKLEASINGTGAGEVVTLRRHHYPKYYSESDFSLDGMTNLLLVKLANKSLPGFFYFNPEKIGSGILRGVFPADRFKKHFKVSLTAETQGEGPELVVARYLQKHGLPRGEDNQEVFIAFRTYFNAKLNWIRNILVALLMSYDSAVHGIRLKK